METTVKQETCPNEEQRVFLGFGRLAA